MAIINTLAKCLDSPYLVVDPEAPARIPELLKFADGRLEAAGAIQAGQGDTGDAVAFCYEAMFACIRSLVYAKGYREAGLRCLLLACEEWYVVPGQLDVAHLHAFERAQSIKLAPAEALEAARALRARTSELLQFRVVSSS